MDPRIARTRRSLRQAMFALVSERAVEDISISEIAARAETNRSTFYQHYNDVGALLADVVDAHTREAMADVAPGMSDEAAHRVLRPYLDHIHDHLGFYRRAFDAAVALRVQQRVRDHLVTLLPEVPQSAGAPGVLPTTVVASAIAGSALAIIDSWIREPDPASVDDVCGWIWQVMVAIEEGCAPGAPAPQGGTSVPTLA